MRIAAARPIFSPHDLLNYLECPYVSWMDRLHLEKPGQYAPDAPGEFVGTIQAAGVEHEQQFVEILRSQLGSILDLTASRDCHTTLDAMMSGHPVLYQAWMECEDFSGIADFLVRVDGKSKLGAHHYEVWDTKLAREPKPHYLV